MNIFNSLGSNYSFTFGLKTLFAKNDPLYKKQLEDFLTKKYFGKVYLFYKAREAIFVALTSLGLPKGSGVAINGYTCYAVYKAIIDAGMKPVYVDVPSRGLNFTAEQLSEVASKENVRVVIVQNTLGFTCDIKNISLVCKEKNLVLMEDLAHCIGAKYESGEEAGTVGDFTVLSFSQDKVVDGISGGALVVRNKKYHVETFETQSVSKNQQLKDRWYPSFTQKIRFNYNLGLGKLTHWVYKKLGWLPSPMAGLDAIVLHELPNWYSGLIYSQFQKSEGNLHHKREIAKVYAENLDRSVQVVNVEKQVGGSSNLRFPILVKDRKGLIDYLKALGVHVSDIWYDAPIGPKKFLEKTDYNGQCPNAQKLSDEMVNLPTHIHVNGQQAKQISEKINLWLKLQQNK